MAKPVLKNLNYGAIGNRRSGALVSDKGSIEWCCLPEFNSPSVFAKILDEEKGGEFAFIVDDGYSTSQKYINNTNILLTTFKKGKDIFEVLDFMPVYPTDDGDFYNPPDLIRYIRPVRGHPEMRVLYHPKLNYARETTKTVKEKEYIKSFTTNGKYESIYLYSNVDRDKILNSRPVEITEEKFFVVSYNQKIINQTPRRIYLHYNRTKVYWMNWVEKIIGLKDYYNEQIIRSALVLSLLSFSKSGAIIAALTTSIPELPGGVRNWDYRFCWIRDAGMMIQVLNMLGHAGEAKKFLSYLLELITQKDQRLQIMYGIRREKELTEEELPHLSGYMNSRPVRIGNEAYKQQQNDIYGVLLDVLYQNISLFHVALDETEDFWTIVRSLVRHVEAEWEIPDNGIWELRGEARHFTFSKIMCWVAVDRGIKIAEMIGKNDYIIEWSKLREKIKNDILEKAWNDDAGAFTQSYGSPDLDASNLLMETYGFIDARDPRFISTVKNTYKELSRNGLMFRYKNKDDFGYPESSFTICNFWMAKALYITGEKEAAVDLFNRVLRYANHVMLFSEDIDFETGYLLGNFPQGYSHLALIDTALAMSEGTSAEGQLKRLLTAST
ncbi:MAG: glycoside hydrolase family 15 protein [Bacteroidales bacterium]